MQSYFVAREAEEWGISHVAKATLHRRKYYFQVIKTLEEERALKKGAFQLFYEKNQVCCQFHMIYQGFDSCVPTNLQSKCS